MRLVPMCLLALLLLCPSAAATTTTPVSFGVENVNRSALPCNADGGQYRLEGRLVEPERPTGRAVTLYLHEYSFGSAFWSFPDDRYDYAAALARDGHASVVIDRLGYGASATPEGMATCLGAQADMAAQVVAQLRARGYRKVALAGHSVGASVAELAYHSFANIDALAFFGWAHSGYTAASLRESFVQGGVCTRGGEPKRPDGPSGYAFYGQSAEDFGAMAFHDPEPSVYERMTVMRERDPCGDVASLTPSVALNASRADQVRAPVLLVMGEEDRVFEPGTAERQRDAYTASDDVTLVKVPRAGHALTLERTAPQMRAAVADWLTRHGFGDSRAAPAPAPRTSTRPRSKKQRATGRRCRPAKRRARSRRRDGARRSRACRARGRAGRGQRRAPSARPGAAS